MAEANVSPPSADLRSIGRQWGEPNVLRLTIRLRGNEADFLGFIDHGRLPPVEGEVEKLLSRNGIGRAVGLKFVMDRRFEAQAGTTMPLDHATPFTDETNAVG
jgi:hypothetical protein